MDVKDNRTELEQSTVSPNLFIDSSEFIHLVVPIVGTTSFYVQHHRL